MKIPMLRVALAMRRTVERAFHTLISLEHLVTLAWFPQAATPMSTSHLQKRSAVTEDPGLRPTFPSIWRKLGWFSTMMIANP